MRQPLSLGKIGMQTVEKCKKTAHQTWVPSRFMRKFMVSSGAVKIYAQKGPVKIYAQIYLQAPAE